MVISENGDSELSGESRVRVMHVKHMQGPVDGSLYATVVPKTRADTPQHKHSSSTVSHQHHTYSTSSSRQQYSSPPGGSTLPNGNVNTSGLYNGPLTQSADSGISSTGRGEIFWD